MSKNAKIKHRLWLKASIILIGLVIILRLTLPFITAKILNRYLPQILNTEASLAGLKLGMCQGLLVVRGLEIKQPQGFDPGIFISIKEASVKIKPLSLFKPPLIVSEVTINNGEFNLVKNSSGQWNTAIFGSETPPSPPPESEPEASGETLLLAPKIYVNNLRFSYSDLTPEKGRLTMKVADCNILITDLIISDAIYRERTFPSSALLTARQEQKPLPDGLLGVFIRSAPLGKGVPVLIATLQLAGLELEPLDPILATGTYQALGGDAVDLSIDLALSPNLLDCDIAVEANGGRRTTLTIGGTPEEPDIDESSILLSILLSSGGGLGRLAANLTGTAFGTAETLGKGTGKVATSIGRGLFKSAKGVVTVDPGKLAEGLGSLTLGTVTTVGETVMDTTGKVVTGLGKTAGIAGDRERTERWRSETPQRWEKSWESAQERVNNLASLRDGQQD